MRIEANGLHIPIVELEDGELVERWLAPGTICAIIGVHRGTLRRWRRDGTVPESAYVTLGPHEFRYRLSSVLVALARRE